MVQRVCRKPRALSTDPLLNGGGRRLDCRRIRVGCLLRYLPIRPPFYHGTRDRGERIWQLFLRDRLNPLFWGRRILTRDGVDELVRHAGREELHAISDAVRILGFGSDDFQDLAYVEAPMTDEVLSEVVEFEGVSSPSDDHRGVGHRRG